ncbi:MAG: hypothetical protein IJ677_00950, partial [Alphaproteobacteria bacterium]|nr:hypothetical protein [Alphaproteobacteria bacterium]
MKKAFIFFIMIGFVNSHGSLLKPLDYFGRCFFVIMLKTKGKNKLTEALVKTGSYKHAVLSDGLCYLSYKDMAYYVESKRKYYSNIDKFNYPCVKPIAYVDECCCVIQPIASGRQLTKEDVYHLLKSLLSYFRNQKFI